MPRILSIALFLFLLFFWMGIPTAQARDPKVEEMGAVQEIAGYLYADAAELYAAVGRASATNPALRDLLDPLGRLKEKAQEFSDKIYKNSRSPWRTSSAYRELNESFVGAQGAFTERLWYQVDPRAFEEIAFLMGALLQFFQEPVYQYTVPGYYYPGSPYPIYPAYPQAYYPWLPPFTTFTNCRFLNRALYPWSQGVVIRIGR